MASKMGWLIHMHTSNCRDCPTQLRQGRCDCICIDTRAKGDTQSKLTCTYYAPTCVYNLVHSRRKWAQQISCVALTLSLTLDPAQTEDREQDYDMMHKPWHRLYCCLPFAVKNTFAALISLCPYPLLWICSKQALSCLPQVKTLGAEIGTGMCCSVAG